MRGIDWHVPKHAVPVRQNAVDAAGAAAPKKPLFVENLVMYRIRMAALALVVSVATAGLTAPVAMAQTTDAAASTPKQAQKAQRKADRKAARTKKNAELKDLEKNGYNPAP
jgi:hypothetical protein